MAANITLTQNIDTYVNAIPPNFTFQVNLLRCFANSSCALRCAKAALRKREGITEGEKNYLKLE